MEAGQIAERLKERFPEEVLGVREFRGQVSVSVKPGRIREICRWLHDDPDFFFDYLIDLCGVDYLNKRENRFDVVYHLYSIRHRHMIRLKAELPGASTTIDSVVPVWAGANWHERECYDLFGISFSGHPDLRRILLPEDWEGYPLRKDYPVKGPQKEWRGFVEVVERSKKYREFDWQG
ncbi:MAG: NADH-quinone oxidoreductase subunit C [Thermodesulfovibrionales bacterium]